LTVASEKAYAINQCNKAAKEIYEASDLVNSINEQLITFSTVVDASGNQVQLAALPYYVDKLRAIRNYYTRRQVDFHDMRPRYKSDGWTENLLAFRKRKSSPIQRDILNAAPLTLTITAAESAAFSVIIVGSTANASRVAETITFAAGDLVKTSVNAFITIDSISNPALHASDVTITDLDGNTLAVLANNQFKSEYLIVQILDYVAVQPSVPYLVEILYKPIFLPFANDGDEFQCSGYDDAIFWQVMGNKKAKSSPDQSALAFAKVAKIINDRSADEDQGIDQSVDFLPNPLLGLYDYPRYGANGINGPLFPGAYPNWGGQ
jgi:hypothetical protein